MRSPWDDGPRWPLRALLGGLAAIDAAALVVAILGASAGPRSHPDAPALLLGLGGSAAVIVPAAAAIAGACAFTRGPARLGAAALTLTALATLVEAHAALVGGPHRVFFATGAGLFGWSLGLVMARAAGERRGAAAERWAEFGAAGALAATYVGAVASKVAAAGLGWIDGDGLRAVILAQRGLGGGSPLDAYAALVVGSRGIATAFAAATMVFQAAAVAFPWSPRGRAWAGAGILLFHLNVWLLTPILFPQAMALVLALALPWPRWLRRRWPRRFAADASAARAEGSTPRVGRGYAAGAATCVALALLFAPLRPYAALHHRAESRGSTEAAEASPALRAALGGLEVGEEMAGFRVVTIGARVDGAIEVVLGRAEVAFTVTLWPTGAGPAEPPVRGRAHDLFYGRPRPEGASLAADERDAAMVALARRIDG